MKPRTLASALAALTLGTVAAPAAAQLYGELAYVDTRTRQLLSGFELKSSPTALRAFIGYTLTPNLSIEGLFMTGLSSDAITANGTTISGSSADIDHGVGLYARPGMKLAENVEVFGRVGFARFKGTAALAGFGSESDSETSVSFGAGLAYLLSPRAKLTFDWMQYLKKDGFKASGLALGLGFMF